MLNYVLCLIKPFELFLWFDMKCPGILWSQGQLYKKTEETPEDKGI